MSAQPDDAGLFGPDSVSWQLHAEPAMWLAGIRSLYLQALHPRAVAGIVQNSDFRGDPLGRLVRTANFVGATTYCPRDEVERQAAKVRAVHRSLRGTHDGRTFRIDEPELLLWVHCAEVSSFLTVVRRAGFPLTAAHADRYLDEQRRSAALVGLDPGEVPGSVAAMRDYLRAMRPVLRRTDDTDAIYDFLHRPPVGGRLALGLPAYETLVGHLAYSLLPGWAVTVYGRRAYPHTISTAMMRTLSETLRALQKTVRTVVREPRLGPLVPHPVLAARRLGDWAFPSARKLPAAA
ncbi:oxygenase MpaB family protein [Actinophytocola glycyrrhizae]|uniref:Oxygenase MpaB family protein n=1 Tax=Actinophytocola glycyrrhizae TaxID=2044873 RepID=A0ABV9S9H8_9PSEU